MRRLSEREDPSHLVDSLQEVPDITDVPTVDELNTKLFELAEDLGTEPQQVGTSLGGEPIWEVTAGDGPARGLIVGGVHANEVVGMHTALTFLQTLKDADLRDRLGYTWHVIGCIGPDDVRSNEGWFTGPFTRGHYGRHAYRPAPEEDIEWGFPFQYKQARFTEPRPETVTFKTRIDDIRPDLLVPLHNVDCGGVHYYVSRPVPGLYRHLHAIPAALGLPVDIGDVRSDIAHAERLADGVWRVPHPREQYDLAEAAGLDPTGRGLGMSSTSYAAQYGTLAMHIEVPYWPNPDAGDPSPTDQTYASSLATRADGLQQTVRLLEPMVAAAGRDVRADSPFLRATRVSLQVMNSIAADRHRAGQPVNARPATRAERFNCAETVHLMRVRYGGMLLHALDDEIAAGTGSPRGREQRAALARTYDRWVEDAAATTPHETIPFGTIVAAQRAAILATSAFARPAG